MKTKYLCPHCRSILNINEDVVLVVKKKTGLKGIVMLHATLGNYTSKKSEHFIVEDQEEVDFYCPVCSKDLEYKFKIQLANLLMIDENMKESVIVFSKIYKKQCTYQIMDKKIYSYGECAQQFSDPDWFL